jgi:hypothetical protein
MMDFSNTRHPALRAFLFVSLSLLAHVGFTAEFHGQVSSVQGQGVSIRLEENIPVAVGDRVDLVYVTSSGRRLEVGEWRVKGVHGSQVEAEPANPLGTPRKGLRAIFTAAARAPGQAGSSTILLPPPKYVPPNVSGAGELPPHLMQSPTAPGEPQFPTGASIFSEDYNPDGRPGQASQPVMRLGFDDFVRGREALQQGKDHFGNKRYEEARIAFEQAQKSEAEASFYLSLIHSSGLGVQPDATKSWNLTMQAANGGLAIAQHIVGQTYRMGGRFVGRDMAMARYWFDLAAKQGYSASQQALRDMEGEGKQ